jgi:hypothetical protein
VRLLLALAAAHLVSLPSPLTPLTPAPPVGGGAHASGEGVIHRVSASTRVTVLVAPSGTPTAVRATQRLDVRQAGDYVFVIGAPVRTVTAAPGSAAPPGRRTGAILWAGFNPGRRTLAASADLDASALPSLPLRIDVHGSQLTLHNTTTVTTRAFTADARPDELLATLAAFRRGSYTAGTALLTSDAKPVDVTVTAPLEVTGTIGRRHVDLILGPLPATFPAGDLRLSVRPAPSRALLSPPAAEAGRALLARTVRASLQLALVRQYQAYLGNPDRTGPSSTSYVYVTDHRTAAPAAVPETGGQGRNWWSTLLWITGAVVVLGVGAVVWSRS